LFQRRRAAGERDVSWANLRPVVFCPHQRVLPAPWSHTRPKAAGTQGRRFAQESIASMRPMLESPAGLGVSAELLL